MQSLRGKKVQVTLDEETLRLERLYKRGKEPARSRAEIIRELYREYLKKHVVEKR